MRRKTAAVSQQQPSTFQFKKMDKNGITFKSITASIDCGISDRRESYHRWNLRSGAVLCGDALGAVVRKPNRYFSSYGNENLKYVANPNFETQVITLFILCGCVVIILVELRGFVSPKSG